MASCTAVKPNSFPHPNSPMPHHLSGSAPKALLSSRTLPYARAAHCSCISFTSKQTVMLHAHGNALRTHNCLLFLLQASDFVVKTLQ